MKLSNLGMVQRAVAALTRLDVDIGAVENGLFTVSIGTALQDQAISCVCKAPILTELKARRAALLRDLKSYGVEVD